MTGSVSDSHPPRSPLLDATAGALAGCISRLVIGPLDVLKIRFQVQLEPIGTRAQKAAIQQVASKYTGIGQALKTIAAEEGIQVCSSQQPNLCSRRSSSLPTLLRISMPACIFILRHRLSLQCVNLHVDLDRFRLSFGMDRSPGVLKLIHAGGVLSGSWYRRVMPL